MAGTYHSRYERITAIVVREVFDLDPSTGTLTWRPRLLRDGDLGRTDRTWNSKFAGKPVAERRHRHGHLQIGIGGKNYMAHRIIWMHYYGAEPNGNIDHINGVPDDNRIENLRLATQSENLCNARRRTDNTSGRKGVSWSRREQKWYAYINKNQKMIGLGRFATFEEACAARSNAEVSLHGEFARS